MSFHQLNELFDSYFDIDGKQNKAANLFDHLLSNRYKEKVGLKMFSIYIITEVLRENYSIHE